MDFELLLHDVWEQVSQHLLLFGLVILGEMVIAVVLKWIAKKSLGLHLPLHGWIFVIVITPTIHHISHLLPVIGHVVSTLGMGAVYGAVYMNKSTGKPLGFAGGIGMLLLRLLIHYATTVGAIVLLLRHYLN